MAAVMMRAMGVGSSKGEKPAPNGDEEGLSLSRQTSRLQPPYNAAGNPMGILINPLRPPSAPNSPPPISPYNNSSAASSLASVNLPRVLSGSDLANRSSYASSLASVPSSPTDERGRSSSRDSATRGTTTSPRPGMPTTILSDTGLTKIESLENRKIRFAPLPEITGRDGEWDVAGLDDVGEELSRSQSAGLINERGTLEAMDDEDDEDERDNGRTGSMFGSWKSDNSFGGRRSTDDDDRGSGSSSYTSKLLRPLSFGLVGKKKRSSSKGRASSSADSLSRVSSNESDISRGSSMDGGFRPTGIPMRKTRTWESNDSGGPRESRRAQYPPVAQRSRTARRPLSISAPDPTFNEWGAGASVGSVGGKSAAADEDEDDGGGMAWIKKRRAQREAEKKAAEEEAERKRKEEEEAEMKGEEEGAGADEEDVPFALDEDEDGDGDTTMEQPLSSSDAHAGLSTNSDHPRPATNPSSSTTTPTISTSTTPKPQHSLLGMTRPSLNVVTATPEASPAIGSKSFDHSPSLAGAQLAGATIDSPVSIGTPPRHHDDDDDSGHAQRLSDKLGKLAIGGRSTIHRAPVSPVDDDSDEESDEDDDEEDEDNGDDSDLDEDELAKEEALAEQARKTAKSAGAERFHSAGHKSSVVEVEGRRPAPARSGTLTQPSRQGTIVPASRQSTL
ncbi:hypothetical protein BCR35DRAFT_214380 [Leucosporidium creatinivorum]|uniref:Uncharacterized protein n=1 Tax=Leucosporidium creatinivorum TaxID=106004 RepID=A0A1Y2DB74_9BASI|nr:hypothetical protein BCR35DRAFT_214380 [Leucosporidium creatinivorum]